ncbi:hypothetical protein ACWA1C_24480 [Flectobacillus roseus]|nr:hypothetical protein [Emticicia sp. ODNR4P]
MREYTIFAQQDEEIQANLSLLADKQTRAEIYANALSILGKKLALHINPKITSSEKIVLACTSEDADWLGKGILQTLWNTNINLAVFWNLRAKVDNDRELTIAPIVKSYIEEISNCKTLIICKSIIYTSCVVRTNLMFLINQINPDKIFIVAPVMFKSAENSLNKEFESSISKKFEYIYFAIDDEISDEDEVIPGIGGNIYQRLGLGDTQIKNKYIPLLVKDRRNAIPV